MINDNKIIILEKLATEFRDAIEKRIGELKIISPKFEYFPNNCCGNAANLLAKYFEIKGCGKFDIVSGERDENQPHHWLKQDSIIVDITADQFSDCEKRIIVTTNESWHNTFDKNRHSHLSDFNKFTDAPIAHSSMFDIITDELKKSS